MTRREDNEDDFSKIEPFSQLANTLSTEYNMLLSLGADPSVVALNRIIPFDLLTTNHKSLELLTYDELSLMGPIKKLRGALFYEDDLRKQLGISDVHTLLQEMCRKNYVKAVGPDSWRQVVGDPQRRAEQEEDEQFDTLVEAANCFWSPLGAVVFAQKGREIGSRRWRPSLITRRMTRSDLDSQFGVMFSAMSEALRVIEEREQSRKEEPPETIVVARAKADLFKARAEGFKALVDGSLTLGKAILTASAGVSLLIGTLHITSPEARDGIRRISATILAPEKAFEMWIDDGSNLRQYLRGGEATQESVTQKGGNTEVTIQVRAGNN